MHRAARSLALPLAFLALAAPAHAAPAPGAIAQLDGKDGCVANRLKVCARGHGLDDVEALAASRDGRFIYAVSSYLGVNSALTTFARKSTGALKQRGCVSEGGTAPCARGRGLTGAIEVIVSPDGRNVYVAAAYTGGDSENRSSLAVFARDPKAGAVKQLRGTKGCIGGDKGDRCASGRALAGLGSVTISPDGRFVYAASANANAVLVFARDASDGSLRQLDGTAGCVEDKGGDGCATGLGLHSAVAVIVSPDGRHLYTAASIGGQAVAEFARDQATGALTQLGCISQKGVGGCDAGHGLGDAVQVEISPDGRNVYAAAFRTHSVAVLTRDRASGRLTQSPGRAGCVASGARDGCAKATGISGAVSVTVSPDGRNAYVAGPDNDAVAAFERGAGGRLKQLPGASSCIGHSFFCRAADGLGLAFDVLVSPDGRNVYAAGSGDDAIVAFKRG
jgi:DNA-binding beta-propeller fold protein YncE